MLICDITAEYYSIERSSETRKNMAIVLTPKTIRQANGDSQSEFAKKMAMSVQNVQKIEQGITQSFTLRIIEKYCELSGCSSGEMPLMVYVKDSELHSWIEFYHARTGSYDDLIILFQNETYVGLQCRGIPFSNSVQSRIKGQPTSVAQIG